MNVRVDLDVPIQDGTEVVFRAPCDYAEVTGLTVYYPVGDAIESKTFAFADANVNDLASLDVLFAKDAVVKVILDLNASLAFVQNADTNMYLESRIDGVDLTLPKKLSDEKKLQVRANIGAVGRFIIPMIFNEDESGVIHVQMEEGLQISNKEIYSLHCANFDVIIKLGIQREYGGEFFPFYLYPTTIAEDYANFYGVFDGFMEISIDIIKNEDTGDTEYLVTGRFIAQEIDGTDPGIDNVHIIPTVKAVRDAIEAIELTPGPQGEKGADGKDGTNGKDGVSVTRAEIDTTGSLVLYFSNNTSVNLGRVVGEDGTNGTNGANGSDGNGISNTKINNNGELVITYTSGQEVNVGKVVGDAGKDGYSPTKGKDYFDGTDGVSTTHQWNGTTLTVTSASGTSSADLKGDKGDKGEPGAPGKDGDSAFYPEVFELTTQALFDNVLDDVGLEYGTMLNNDGTTSSTTAALCTTGFIPMKQNQTIYMNDIAMYTTGSPKIVLYNANKELITRLNVSSFASSTYYLGNLVTDDNGYYIQFKLVAPGSLAYIRLCTNTVTVGTNPIISVDQPIEYEEGYGSKLNQKISVDYSQITNAPQKNGWSILPYEHINIAYSSIGRKPINTIEHFIDAAGNYGYNALKCDVRPTADGELVCCHDAGFTFDGNGYITTYDSNNSTVIHNVTAETCLGYSFKTGEHPCLVGDYLKICRKYGKVAFVTIRNEYMDVVIPKLIAELKKHNMVYSTIINCMTYESLVTWRQHDTQVMINYTLNYGVEINSTYIDRAVGLGYCSLCGFSLSSAATEPSASCDFDYAREKGIRLLQAIAYAEGSPEACYDLGYDGCQIGIPWSPTNA